MAHDIARYIMELVDKRNYNEFEFTYGVEVEDQANAHYEEIVFKVGKDDTSFSLVEGEDTITASTITHLQPHVIEMIDTVVNRCVAWTEGFDRPLLSCTEHMKVSHNNKVLSEISRDVTDIFNKHSNDFTMRQKGLAHMYKGKMDMVSSFLDTRKT